MENKLCNFTDKELIMELNRRNLVTNSKSNDNILNDINNSNDSVQVILTKGMPSSYMECRECKEKLPSKNFSYYLSRVDQNGYLMRSNALCHTCNYKSNKERKLVLDSCLIPEKPKKGSECPHCNRKWNGNWHRHHEGDKFIEWLCGHCNMSFSDQRNKRIKK